MEAATAILAEGTIAIAKLVIERATSTELSLASGSIQRLQNRFIYVSRFLNDLATANHAENIELVNFWLEKLKGVAYSADQVIDDYAYEMLRRKHEVNIKDRCRSFVTPSTNHVVFCLRINRRVNRILSELDLLHKEANEIGLKLVDLAKKAVSASSSGGQSPALFQARMHAAARGPDFIGRERDMKDLLEMLLCPSVQEDKLSIFAIVGIGGRLMAFVPQCIPRLHRLQHLYIGGFQEEWDMRITSTLTSLRNLELFSCPNLKLLPDQPLQHLIPPSLRHLQINRFDEMEALPEWIGCLSSLNSLYIFHCDKLKYLPSKEAIQRLSCLRDLNIGDCPLLEERCVKDNGLEWQNLSYYRN